MRRRRLPITLRQWTFDFGRLAVGLGQGKPELRLAISLGEKARLIVKRFAITL
jgi:hypothetical protein